MLENSNVNVIINDFILKMLEETASHEFMSKKMIFYIL
jgi:hypothetical protein